MNILYLHGLESKLSEEKRKVLEIYGNVIAPDIQYQATNTIIQDLASQYSGRDLDAIMGSSMGGFAAYYLSLIFNVDCLVFNPALPYRTVEQLVPEVDSSREKYIQYVIGYQDQVIKAADNLQFILPTLNTAPNASIHVISSLAHRITFDVFEKEVKCFFTVR